MKWKTIALWAMVLMLLPGCSQKPRSAAKAFIQEHYPDQADWRLESYPDFFRSPNDTWVRAYAPDSQDLYFELYYHNSEARLEDYHDEGIESSLCGRHTYHRLFNEYHDLLQKKQQRSGLGLNLSVKLLSDQAAQNALWEQGIVYLDIPFSTDLPLEWEIYYWSKQMDHTPTLEEAVEDIQALGKFISDNALPATRLSGHLSPRLGPDSHFDIPTELAYDPDLLTKLESAMVEEDWAGYHSWTVEIP